MMPALLALSEGDLDDVVSYVIHLAIRGESEFATLAQILNENSDDFGSEGVALQWVLTQNILLVLENWGIAARTPFPFRRRTRGPTMTGSSPRSAASSSTTRRNSAPPPAT